MQQTRTSSENCQLKVRCPSCKKLYSIQLEAAQTQSPRFLCKGCDRFFWLPEQELLKKADGREIFGLKSQPLSSAAQKGVTQEGHAKKAATPKRLLLWKDLIDHFEDESRHESFIAFCDKEGRLTFAAERYQSVLTAVGADSLTEKYLTKVKSLVELQARDQLKTASLKRKEFAKTWGWFIALSLLGLSMIGLGYFVLHLKNVAGLGAALLFFVVTIQSYLRSH